MRKGYQLYLKIVFTLETGEFSMFHERESTSVTNLTPYYLKFVRLFIKFVQGTVLVNSSPVSYFLQSIA